MRSRHLFPSWGLAADTRRPWPAALAPAAQAAGVTILAPGFIDNAGVKDLAAAYTKAQETGVTKSPSNRSAWAPC